MAESPGSVLVERFLKPNDITQQRLSLALRQPASAVNAICRGRRAITPKVAKMLGKALGTDPMYWLDLDARYQLDKTEDASDVEVLIEEDDMQEAGGYVFSDLQCENTANDTRVRNLYRAASNIDSEERESLFSSVEWYLMHGIVSVPGTEKYLERLEDMPDNAMALFEQFLLDCGEDLEEVVCLFHDARVEMVAEIGKTDEDGVERPAEWRTAKTVNLDHVGELMCACTQLGFEQGNLVMDSLFHYTHDDTIVMPGVESAVDACEAAVEAFKRFLRLCGEPYDKIEEIAKAQLGE